MKNRKIPTVAALTMYLLVLSFAQAEEYRGTQTKLYVRIFDGFLVLPNRFWIDNRFMFAGGHCTTLMPFLDSEASFLGDIGICGAEESVQDEIVSKRVLNTRYPNRSETKYLDYRVLEFTQDPNGKVKKYKGKELKVVAILKDTDFLILHAVTDDKFWQDLLNSITLDKPL